MRAVRLHGKGIENVTIDTVPVPAPNENQALARVDAAGVCSSNLKILAQASEHTYFNGWDPAMFPTILGDEGCITIVKSGANVAAEFPEGARCLVQPAVDHPPVNHRERYTRNAENMLKVAVGYTLPGHLSEYMLVQEEVLRAGCLLKLPPGDFPAFAGALCEPLSCVISAQDRHVHISKAGPVAPRKPKLGLLKKGVTMIVGAGPMGRLHAEVALNFKPAHLLVVDVAESRLEWVRSQLAPLARSRRVALHALLSKDAQGMLDNVSNGLGADDIIVAVGNRQVQIQAQQWLAKGGNLNLFGGLKRGEHVIDLDTLRVHYDEIRICGSSGGAPSDVARAMRMIVEKSLDPGRHLGMVGSLDQFHRAMEMIENTEVDGKIVLYPHIRQTDLREAEGWDFAGESAFLGERRKSPV